MRDTEYLGAGDPGALDALFGTRAAEEALAEAYRRCGWVVARTNPLDPSAPLDLPELDPARYGLTADDAAPLRTAYCGPSAGSSPTSPIPPVAPGWPGGRRWIGLRPQMPAGGRWN